MLVEVGLVRGFQITRKNDSSPGGPCSLNRQMRSFGLFQSPQKHHRRVRGDSIPKIKFCDRHTVRNDVPRAKRSDRANHVMAAGGEPNRGSEQPAPTNDTLRRNRTLIRHQLLDRVRCKRDQIGQPPEAVHDIETIRQHTLYDDGRIPGDVPRCARRGSRISHEIALDLGITMCKQNDTVATTRQPLRQKVNHTLDSAI